MSEKHIEVKGLFVIFVLLTQNIALHKVINYYFYLAESEIIHNQERNSEIL